MVVQSSDGSPFNAIDPSVINADGTNLLTFGSFWQDIHQVALADPPTKTNGSPAQIAFDPVTTEEEGAALFRNGDFYYLFYSKGKCCNYDKDRPAAGAEYKILVCRSNSATGGFVDADGKECTNGGGTVVLESHDNVYGPGGQGVYDDPTHGPVSLNLETTWLYRTSMLNYFHRYSTTTMSTRTSGSRTDRNSSAGTRLTFRAVGPSYRPQMPILPRIL